MSQSQIAQRIPPELLQQLSAMFPNRVPDINTPDREVWAKVGEQRVIDWLRHQFNLQNENILTE